MAPKTPFNDEEDNYIIRLFNDSFCLNKKLKIPLEFQSKFNRPTLLCYNTLWNRFN